MQTQDKLKIVTSAFKKKYTNFFRSKEIITVFLEQHYIPYTGTLLHTNIAQTQELTAECQTQCEATTP